MRCEHVSLDSPMVANDVQLSILHVYKTYFPDTAGGLERTIEQICLQTNRLGFRSAVLTLSSFPHPRIIQRPEATVYRYRSLINLASTPISVRLLYDFPSIISRYDLLHYHFPWPFADIVHLWSRTTKPVVVTYHSDIVKQRVLKYLYKDIMRRFLGRADRIVVTSPNYLETSADLQPFRKKCTVIPFGFDESSYPPVQTAVREYWKGRLGERFFLFIGVLRYYKGLNVLLQAARNTSHRIVIVGSGPLEAVLRRQARKFGLRHVEFLGVLPDNHKVALLSLCLAVVFPSYLRSEAFGITLLEGLMFGKPLISAEIGTGTTYINVGETTGIVIPPGDAQALRHAMDRLAVDDELAQRMGRAARQRYQQLFAGDRMGSAYSNLYRAVVSESAVNQG